MEPNSTSRRAARTRTEGITLTCCARQIGAPLLLTALAACGAEHDVAPTDGAELNPTPDAALEQGEAREPETAAELASGSRSAYLEGSFQGIQLSPEQALALSTAHAARPEISLDEVADLLGLDAALTAPSREGRTEAPALDPGLGRLSQAQRSGEDSSIGDCSIIFLLGFDDGRYHFEQQLLAGASALFGEIVISTDGLLAIPDIYGVEGPTQIFEDDLFEGIFGTGTTMSGWMFTSNNNLCFGELFAVWE